MKKKLDLKIEYVNIFDVAVFDNNFFSILLSDIKKIENKELTEKTDA